MEKKLKITLCIVIMCLIALISFIGIYVKDGAIFKNVLPDYVLSSEFKEKAIAELSISEDTQEVIYDKDGNVVSEIPEGANEEDYKKEQVKINKEEDFTSENFKKVKNIMDKRLDGLGIQDYIIRMDENTGNAIVELEDNMLVDTILQYLLYKGDFALTDSADGTVLMDKSHVKEAKVLYGQNSSSNVVVYLDIVFNKEGKEKLAQISRDYMKIEGTDGKDENQKKVALIIEGHEMLSTYFDEEITRGELPISMGSSTSSDGLSEYIEQAQVYSMLINNETMPVTYDVAKIETINGNLSQMGIYVAIGMIIIIAIAMIIYMVWRYKVDGIFASISLVFALSLLLLIARYTYTQISLNSIAGVIILMLLDVYIISKMLNSIKANTSYDNVAKTTFRVYLDNIEIIVVSLILGIVFTFMQYAKAFSFGMILFYGMISIAITNIIFLRTMLLAKYGKN